MRIPFRVFVPNLLLIGGIAGLIAGGFWITVAGVAVVLFGTLVDELVGDSLREFGPGTHAVYTVNLFATVPLFVVMTILFAQQFSDRDALGAVALFASWGIDLGGGPALMGPGPAIAATIMVGIFYAIGAFVVAHELIHWRENPAALIAGRFLLGFTFFTSFSISHLHCHHRLVGTWEDPTTARRNETFAAFFLRSIVGYYAAGYRHEAKRLRRRGHSWLSWRNVALRGELWCVAIVAAVAFIGGPPAVVAFLAAAFIGRVIVEAINYVQHFGLVRVEGATIEARHSWDCHRAISGAVLYNLTRHADHHRANRRAWETAAVAGESPILPYGYKTMALIALLPPLFRAVMDPLLADWDNRLASPGERRLIEQRGWAIGTAMPGRETTAGAPQ
jgi:alkane 1-monooxygenase